MITCRHAPDLIRRLISLARAEEVPGQARDGKRA